MGRFCFLQSSGSERWCFAFGEAKHNALFAIAVGKDRRFYSANFANDFGKTIQNSGPQFSSTKPNCVPILPITFQWHNAGHTTLSRQQLPLRLSYVVRIHQSQGQTLPKAVVDIGDGEMAAECTFMAVSRLKSLWDGLFMPMTFERLSNPCYWCTQL